MRWFAFALLALVFANAEANSGKHCRNLYRLTNFEHAVEPGRLVPTDGAVAEHCRVRAVVNRAIRVEVTMPAEGWNRRLMFSTVGGGAGSIGDTQSLLGRGFAMASTDTGHQGQGMEFMSEPEPLLDYAFRGVHLATLFAKKVIETYYERDIEFSYLKGCSNGGRAALLEAVLFPTDYDGIIAGAPAFRFQEFTPWMVEVSRRQAEHPLDKDAFQVLDDASRAACDGLDGVEDGVINDPRSCTADVFDIEALECKIGRTSGCLTAGQIETARFVYEDQLDASGEVVSPGVSPGAEAAGDWEFWMLPNDLIGGEEGESLVDGMGGVLTSLVRDVADFDLDAFDTANDRTLLDDAASFLDVQTADLSEFRENGGKLLIYQGWNDWPLRPQRAIDYLADAEEATGGPDQTADFFRLFMVPGMVHCALGPGAWVADYVDPLVAWREDGEAPDEIQAARPADAETQFTRPLCVYPKLASYNGRGDPTDADNFSCK